ncbi:MAG TPA: YceI family protein [Cytophagaceae bacterium]|jgi:polyisoprenoid-binding protein YceI|nr:YceI family protein [Cytophagaceae bacterium]
MKLRNLFIALTATAAVAMYSCGPSEKPVETVKTDSIPVTYNVIADSSTVNWKGTMVGVYSHSGTIKLTEGSLTLTGGKFSAGSFTVDMKSITPLDSNYNEKDHKKEFLVGHLSAPDFFAADSFPTAKFVVKSVEGSTAIGDLTVRGKTNEEKVTDIVITSDSSSVSATGKLVFDRQKYGVAYKPTVKDMVLSNDIEITVALKGKK